MECGKTFVFSVSLLTRMSTRNFQATPKKNSEVSVPGTPKKIFKASVPADFSTLQAVQSSWGQDMVRNLFSRANRPLLAAASMPQKISLSGQTLIQDKYIDLFREKNVKFRRSGTLR